jgi:hypothetical protein
MAILIPIHDSYSANNVWSHNLMSVNSGVWTKFHLQIHFNLNLKLRMAIVHTFDNESIMFCYANQCNF